jgi:hypothetical protein
MKKTVIAAASVLSMAFAMPAFAIEAGQTTQQSAPDFEQTKADYMKRLDERITSLQQQKTCVQKATDQNALGACWSQHKTEMKNQRGMGTQVPSQGQ